jgi:predicted MFS family arabinose efflux permease
MPATASGLSTFVAGVVLVRFSALGSFSGKLTPRLRERIVALVLLGGGSVVVLVAFAVFASFPFAMPGVILAVTPERETSSAMSFNKVVRSVAFSLGSAFGGLMLAAGTNTGHSSPVDGA